MRATFNLISPIPPGVDSSYGNIGFYKLGVCVWEYDGYYGQTEWINYARFATEPKYQGASALHYWFFPGVHMAVNVVAQVQGLTPSDIAVNGVATNPVTGKNMPLVLD